MSKQAVLASIRPKWCAKIFSGVKNLEFRKNAPKIELPFTCYVYCSQKQQRLLEIIKDVDDVYGDTYHGTPIFIKTDAGSGDTEACINGWCGRVIGEMVIDKIEEITVRGADSGFPFAFYGDLPFEKHPLNLNSGGITLGEYLKYKGKGNVYGWHIADYTLYKEPKAISSFILHGREDRVQKPPQSWCYVEGMEKE